MPSDAKPILSPAQVELCAKAMGWQKLDDYWDAPGVYSNGGWFDKRLPYETDPRFWAPAETLLKAHGWTFGMDECDFYYAADPNSTRRFLGATPEDPILHAVKAAICGDTDE